MIRLRKVLLGWTGKVDTIGSAISGAAQASPGSLAGGQLEVHKDERPKKRRNRSR